jgi:hypothetical protein
MKKQTLDTNTINTIINILNTGAKVENKLTVAAGYTAAVAKGTAKGTWNGLLLGWNYDSPELRKHLIK